MCPLRARGQAGATLVEVLVLVGVAVPMVLASALGLSTAMTTSAATQARQDLEVALASFGEDVRAMPAYTPCATPAGVLAQWEQWPQRSLPEDGPIEVEVVSVQHWDRVAAEFVGECADDGGAHRLVVRVRTGDTSLTGTFVQRDGSAGRAPEVGP